MAGFFYIHAYGIYFLKCVDPEYAYLFNGALIANLKPEISYFLHPGTPLVCLIAAVIRVVHLFRPEADMLTDVLKNPEVFIRSTLYTIDVLGGAVLFLLGYFTYKKSRNLFLAVFIQLIPIVHNLGLETQARLIPESIMLIIICLWILLTISFMYKNESADNLWKYSVAFGILFGFSLADKLTLFPFVLIPLIILPRLKAKLQFALISVISFFVFAFPILLKHHVFYTWVKNIILHTGSYGGGDRGIVHWNEFIYHLKLQVSNTTFLITSLVILAVGLMVYLFADKKGFSRDPLKIKLAISIILVVIIQYLITSKHFAYHYMLPAILLTLPMLLLTGSMILQIFPAIGSDRIIKIFLAFGFVIILVTSIPGINRQLAQMNSRTKIYIESFHEFEKYRPQGPLIVSASYYGCSAIEYALTFGIQESGKYNGYMLENVNYLYPSTHLYFPWANKFYEGSSEILPSSFIKPGMQFTLLIADYTAEQYDKVMMALSTGPDSLKIISKKIDFNSPAGEALYSLQVERNPGR
jgi:uncharacterized membrane protein